MDQVWTRGLYKYDAGFVFVVASFHEELSFRKIHWSCMHEIRGIGNVELMRDYEAIKEGISLVRDGSSVEILSMRRAVVLNLNREYSRLWHNPLDQEVLDILTERNITATFRLSLASDDENKRLKSIIDSKVFDI